MLTDFFIRILIGIGVALIASLISKNLPPVYRLGLSIIFFVLAVILSLIIKPLPRVVPNVVGYFEQDAKRIMSEAGLNFAVTYESMTSESNEHRVVEQNPQGGIRVEKGFTVNLIIGRQRIYPPQPPLQNPSNNNLNLMIEFVRPRQGDYVPQFADVEYRVDGSIPAGYREVLLVEDLLGQYWSWGTLTGRQRRVQIGEAEDSGKQFTLIVLITNQEIRLGVPYQSLPEGIYQSSITVTRQ